jgi:DNA polymerase elongation subunit (family B)
MLSHEPKNYALLGFDGSLVLRGVAFRSSRSEPYGEDFLRKAIRCLLTDDVAGVRKQYLATIRAVRTRELPTYDLSSRVRLTKSPREYALCRATRRELPYEALLASGSGWSIGDRVRVYRKQNDTAGIITWDGDESATDPRDYDAEHYVRLLRDSYAERLARALTANDFETVFAGPDQFSLFDTDVGEIHPVLRILSDHRHVI